MSILKINTIYNTICRQQNIININKSLIKCNQTIINKKKFVMDTYDSNQIIKINKCLTDYRSSILFNEYNNINDILFLLAKYI